jgi:hypothetical protein
LCFMVLFHLMPTLIMCDVKQCATCIRDYTNYWNIVSFSSRTM